MRDHSELLLALLSLVDGLASPAPAPRRGRPDIYADHLNLTGLVVLARRVWQAHGLLAIVREPTP